MADSNDLANSRAAKMLAAGLRRASEERGLSMRQVAKLLNYKQAVVLSHMALGRVPIPIDRAEQFAEVLDLDKQAFLAAVVEQRHPEVDWSLLAAPPMHSDATTNLAQDLHAIMGGNLSNLSAEHRRVIREVAADRHPAKRWLTVHEVPVIELVRRKRPNLGEAGLNEKDRAALETALVNVRKDTPR